MILEGPYRVLRKRAEAAETCRVAVFWGVHRGLDWGLRVPVRVELFETIGPAFLSVPRSLVVPEGGLSGDPGRRHNL